MAQNIVKILQCKAARHLASCLNLHAQTGLMQQESKGCYCARFTGTFSTANAVIDVCEDGSSVAKMDMFTESFSNREAGSHSGESGVSTVENAQVEENAKSDGFDSLNQHVDFPRKSDRCYQLRENDSLIGTLRKILTSSPTKHVASTEREDMMENVRPAVTEVSNGEDNDAFAELDFPSSVANGTEIVTESPQELPSSKGESTPKIQRDDARRLLSQRASVSKKDFIQTTKKDSHHDPSIMRPHDAKHGGSYSSRNGWRMKNYVQDNQKLRNDVTNFDNFSVTRRSICVEYVPQGISLSHLRAALSVYGDIIGSFFHNRGNGIFSCYIEYKTVDSMEKALAARWIIVNGKQLSLARADSSVTTVVRISNVSPQTSIAAVHNVCMNYGKVENLVGRNDGSMDVYYSVDEKPNMSKILGKLNEISMNGTHWVALLAPKLPSQIVKTTEGQLWAGEQLNDEVGRIRRHLKSLRIALEDLEELHKSIMHLQECPKAVDIDASAAHNSRNFSISGVK